MNSDFSKGEKFERAAIISGKQGPIKVTLHEHEAEKAGKHYDLRLGGYGDWAIKYFPESIGEKRLAIKQPTHPIEYYSFEGTIHSGYGKGNVKIVYTGMGDVQEWSDNKIKFSFNGKYYVLLKTGSDANQWLIMRVQNSMDKTAYMSMTGTMDSGFGTGLRSMTGYHHTSQINRRNFKAALVDGSFEKELSKLIGEKVENPEDKTVNKGVSIPATEDTYGGVGTRAANPLDHNDLDLFRGVNTRAVQDMVLNRYT